MAPSSSTQSARAAPYRLYLYDGQASLQHHAATFDEAVARISAALSGQIPEADSVTVVFNNKRIGKFNVWTADRTRAEVTPAAIAHRLQAMEVGWEYAPASNPRGNRGPSRRRRELRAILDKARALDGGSAHLWEQMEMDIWELLK